MKTNFNNFEKSFCEKTKNESLLETRYHLNSINNGTYKQNKYFVNLMKNKKCN